MDIDIFIHKLREKLAPYVGTYNWLPAVFEEYPDSPDDIFITFCDENLVYQYCGVTDTIREWYVDFSMRIVWKKVWNWQNTTRMEMRTIREATMQVLRSFNEACVTTIRLDGSSNNLIDTETERLYSVITGRIFFRY